MSLTLFRSRSGTASVTPTISIAPNDDTVSVAQGAITAIVYTLTRGGNYAGTVTPSVTGLPTGVTGGWSDSSLTGADSTTTLTLTAAADASLVTDDAFTVTFSGSGVTDAVDSGTVSVTSPDATAWMPNLPSGMTQYGSTFFAPGDVAVYPVFTAPSGLFSTTYPEYGEQRQATVSGQPSGHGTGAWEIFHEGNSYGDGYGPGNLVEYTDRNYKRLYFAASMFFPTGYRAHSLGEKYTYLRTTTNGSASNSFSIGFGPEDVYPSGDPATSNLDQVAVDPMLPGLWIVTHPVYGPYGRPWNPTSVRIPRGQWVQIEVDHKANTPGNADGHVKIWVDGSLCINETGIRYAYTGNNIATPSPYQTTMDSLFFDFSKGGGTSAFATPAEGQSYYFGRLEWHGIV